MEGHTLVQAMVTEPDGSVRVNREIQHAEKIYATLRECREQSGAKKNKGIKMQGYLEKKSEKNKKWKALYFVLLVDATDTHLYLYDNPKRTKPKGLIDLSCAYLYQVRNTHWKYVIYWHIEILDPIEINNIKVIVLHNCCNMHDIHMQYFMSKWRK